MQYTAVKLPTPAGPVTIASQSSRLDDLKSMEHLPENWEGAPVHETDNAACIRYMPKPGFCPLQLFENTRYYLAIPEGCRLSASFDDPDPVPTTKATFTFSIDNYLGTAWLRINELPLIYFDVISRKLNYHQEYRAMVEAIAGQCNQLLLEWSAPTSLRFAADPAKQNQILLEQFLFLRHVLSSEKLELYLEVIRRNPHNILEFEDEWKPAGCGVPAPGYFEQPMRFGRDWMDGGGMSGRPRPAQLISRRKYETLNTPANSFIKFALENFQDLCERVVNCFRDSRGTAWREAHEMRDRLDAFLAAPFFREVRSLSYLPANNQTLQKREGYREIFHAWLMMQAAAQLDWPGREKAYDGTTRDVPTLYEYWLYFVMRRIMRNLEHTTEADITGIDAKTTKPFLERSRDGLRLNLKQGETSLSAFSWSPPETESTLRIHFYFNRIFAPHASSEENEGKEVLDPGSYSRPFRPDYSLVIFPENYAAGNKSVRSLREAERRAEKDGAIAFLHFDAKYRVETLEGIFGKPSPEVMNGSQWEEEVSDENIKELNEEHWESAARNTYKRGDLLKMHAYNEAIRRTTGSYVLYPGRDEQQTTHFRRFHEILPGVGAFTARPVINSDGDTLAMEGEKELRAFIYDVLNIQRDKFSQLYRLNYWTHDTVKEAPCGKGKTKVRAPAEKPSRDVTVLLGYMRRAELAEACRRAKCFYFHALRADGAPETKIELMALKADYLLPFTSGRQVVGWLGRMKSVRLVKRDELCLKLRIEHSQLRSDCSHYFVVELDILDEKPPVTDVSHLVPLRDRSPRLVKWPEL